MMSRGSKATGKWAQKFLDRIEEMNDAKDGIEEKAAVFDKEMKTNPRRMPKMLAIVQAMKKHREDEINENPMLQKLLSIKKHTTTLRNWEPQWDNQLVCLYCATPAIHNCIQCSYCNVVIHNSCLFEYASQIEEYVLHSADGKTFCCCDCMDAQVWHRTAVSGVYQQYKDLQEQNEAAMLITAKIREYVTRKLKLEYVRAVVLLQAKYRCKYARDTFYRWRRTQHRVAVFELEQVLALPVQAVQETPPSEFKPGTAAWRRERVLLASRPPAPCSPRLAVIDEDPLSPFLDKKSVVVMTVIDAGKMVQIFRQDSLLLRALTAQAYLLPGLSCQSTVIFTIYVRTTSEVASQLPPEYLAGAPHIHSQNSQDHGKKGGSGQGPGGISLNQVTAQQYVPLLQGQVPLLFMEGFMYRQQRPINFSSNIMWIPREHKVDGSPLKIQYNTALRSVAEHLLENRARALKRNATAAVAATSPVSPVLVPFGASPPVPAAGAGGAAVSDAPVAAGKKVGFNFASMAKKAVASQPSSLVAPSGGTAAGGLFSPHTKKLLSVDTADTSAIKSNAVPTLAGGSSLQPSRGAEAATNEASCAARTAAKTDEFRRMYSYTCLLNYTPLNPVVNLCCYVLGPRLAVLNRGPEAVEEGGAVRGWKWWLCIIQGRLYFYMYHGDSTPRFVSCLRNASLVMDDGAPDVLMVKHADGRSWRLKFTEYFDVARFKFALAEYQSLAAGDGSLYMPFSKDREITSLKGFRSFGHRCKADFVEDEPPPAAGAAPLQQGAGLLSSGPPSLASPGGASSKGSDGASRKFFPK